MLLGEVSDFKARTGKTRGRAGSSCNDKNKEVLTIYKINAHELHRPVPGK